MQSTGTPDAEFNLTPEFATELLATQHPDLAGLPLVPVESGWDNAIFRLGDELALRLPRRAAAAPLIVHEQTWLPMLAERLPIPAPVPIRVGTPGAGYPWHWSVVRWLHGTPADEHELGTTSAAQMGAFLRELHLPAPAHAPRNPVRGVPLVERADAVAPRMQRLAHSTDAITPRIVEVWQAALQAPLDVPMTWIHGDLHPRNILIDHEEIAGIIDWGDLAAGDRATDLASLWMLFRSSELRQQALRAYGEVSTGTIRRAKGWALLFGAVLLETGLVDNPRNARLGSQILANLNGDDITEW
jgi:aminoglycoside phosphotransferase (APT) family kinase protein